MASFKESEKDGQIGEGIFECFFKHMYHPKGWENYNARREPDAQEKDFDYLLIKNGVTYDIFIEQRMYLSGNPEVRKKRKEKAIAVEVKTDFDITWSGNLCLETISHSMPGCFARTYADYFYYVGIDKKTNNVTCVYLMDVPLMRQYIHKFYARKDKDPNCGISENSRDDEGSSFYLANVEDINTFCKQISYKQIIWDVTELTKKAIEKYGTTCEETNS